MRTKEILCLALENNLLSATELRLLRGRCDRRELAELARLMETVMEGKKVFRTEHEFILAEADEYKNRFDIRIIESK